MVGLESLFIDRQVVHRYVPVTTPLSTVIAEPNTHLRAGHRRRMRIRRRRKGLISYPAMHHLTINFEVKLLATSAALRSHCQVRRASRRFRQLEPAIASERLGLEKALPTTRTIGPGSKGFDARVLSFVADSIDHDPIDSEISVHALEVAVVYKGESDASMVDMLGQGKANRCGSRPRIPDVSGQCNLMVCNSHTVELKLKALGPGRTNSMGFDDRSIRLATEVKEAGTVQRLRCTRPVRATRRRSPLAGGPDVGRFRLPAF